MDNRSTDRIWSSEFLQQPIKKDKPFAWQQGHIKEFQSLKQFINEAPILDYYYPKKENGIHSDASLKVTGYLMMQNSQPVCYTSLSLSDTESKYSNIERERLPACWSLERFNYYIFGKQVIIEVDHKPLENT